MTKGLEKLADLAGCAEGETLPDKINEAAIDLAMFAQMDSTGSTARALQAAFTTYLGCHLAQHPERMDEVLARVQAAILNAKAMFEGGGQVQ